MSFLNSALPAALSLLFFLSQPAAGRVSGSEGEVLSRFGTIERLDDSPDALAAELEAARVPTRGGLIRYVGPGCPFTTIQSAISASSNNDIVRVLTGTYSDAVTVANKSIDLIGGFPDCSATTPTGRSTIDRGGSGVGLDIVYFASDADPERFVDVENFVITGGGGSGFGSGGVVVEGRPGKLSVNFRNVQISDNARTGATDNGGGLRIITTGDAAGFATSMVTFDNDSIFVRNVAAGDGGAIHCSSSHNAGGVTLLRLGTTLVFDNEAENGGGIAVDGCTGVFLYNGGPVVLIFPAGGILGNTAATAGGGIFVSNGGEVQLRAISVAGFGDPDEAALLSGNSAQLGGGARVIGDGSFLRVEDAYVINNNAQQGAAFNVNLGGRVEVGRRAGTGACAPVASGGGVLSRPPCSVIDGNDASSGGGAINLLSDSVGEISRTIIRNNTSGGAGGPIARISNSSLYSGPDTQLRFEGVLMHDNSGGFGIDASNNADVTVAYSTVANNPITEFRVSAAAGRSSRIRVLNSIVDAGLGMSSASGDGTLSFTLDCVIGNLPEGDTGATSSSVYSQIAPEFVDQDGRDYRLRATSPAIDYCDGANAALFPDLNGNTRGVAWNGPSTTVPPSSVAGGLVDLGAYEIPFEITSTDVALRTEPPGQSSLFVNNGDQIQLTLVMNNQSANPAFGPIELIDDFTPGAVINQAWSCAPPPGVSCSPGSGSGDISTTVSGVEPGDQVFFFISADLAQPNQDQDFEYTAIVTESEFNFDSNLSNNTVLLEIRSRLFADGFE